MSHAQIRYGINFSISVAVAVGTLTAMVGLIVAPYWASSATARPASKLALGFFIVFLFFQNAVGWGG